MMKSVRIQLYNILLVTFKLSDPNDSIDSTYSHSGVNYTTMKVRCPQAWALSEVLNFAKKRIEDVRPELDRTAIVLEQVLQYPINDGPYTVWILGEDVLMPLLKADLQRSATNQTLPTLRRFYVFPSSFCRQEVKYRINVVNSLLDEQ